MKFPNTSGNAKVLLEDGNLQDVQYTTTVETYGGMPPSYVASIDNEEVEYDDRLQCYYHMSDDGDIFWNQAAVYKEGDLIADPKELKANSRESSKVLFEQTYVEKNIDPHDYNYAMLVLNSPVLLHHTFNQNGGDVVKAQKDFIEKTWGKEYV